MVNGNTNFYNPYLNMGYPQQQLQPKQEIIRVHGQNGANAYQMAPNSSILLLDETAPVIWLKTTDGASYPTVTGYKITPLETITPQMPSNNDFSELEKRVEKLEEMLNGKSNTSDVKPKAIIKSVGQ
jgi:hypothetical protein